MSVERPPLTDSNPFGQKALEIILDSQQRAARRRRTGNHYLEDRPLIDFGREFSAITFVSSRGEKVNDSNIEESEHKQFTFETKILRELLEGVNPGGTAVAVGRGWYHHTGTRYSPDWDRKIREKPQNHLDHHALVNLSLRLRMSSDAKRVAIKIGAKPVRRQPKGESIPAGVMVFKTSLLPDIAGLLAERLVRVR